MAVLKEFIIENFRCFREEQRIPIRPITLLVGENSTGKSSVLGAYRVLHNMMSTRPGGLSFNEVPFSMGSFQDIVSRFNEGSESGFKLGANLEYHDDRGTKCYEAISFFSEEDARPTLAKIILSSDSKHFFSIMGKGAVVEVFGPSFLIARIGLADQEFESSRGFISALGEAYLNSRGLIPDMAEEHINHQYDQSKKERQPAYDMIHSIFPDEQPGQEWPPLMKKLRKIMLIEDGSFAIAPVRANPQRIYDYSFEEPKPNGEHIPSLMAYMLRQKPEDWKNLQSRLAEFGKESGLFSQIKIKEFGKKLRDSFRIQVKTDKILANLIDVGYGVSQVLPILVEVLAAEKPTRFLLQQPEVHLHPRAQAALGSFFAEEAVAKKHSFIIETQSDFIVDRISISIRRGVLRPEDVALLFFNRTKGGVSIEQIDLDEQGDTRNVPESYRKFFTEESKDFLGFND